MRLKHLFCITFVACFVPQSYGDDPDSFCKDTCHATSTTCEYVDADFPQAVQDCAQKCEPTCKDGETPGWVGDPLVSVSHGCFENGSQTPNEPYCKPVSDH